MDHMEDFKIQIECLSLSLALYQVRLETVAGSSAILLPNVMHLDQNVLECKSFWSLVTVLSTQGPRQCIQVRDLPFVFFLLSHSYWPFALQAFDPETYEQMVDWSTTAFGYKLWSWLSRFWEFFFFSYPIQVCTCLFLQSVSVYIIRWKEEETETSRQCERERSEKVNHEPITSTHVTWPVIDLYWWSRITIYM